MYRLAFVLVAMGLALAACGTTPTERGTTGAGIGAAGGAIIGAVTGLSVLEGALIGTAIGGATGLLTDEEDVNLGEPIWKKWFGPSNDPKSSPQSAAAYDGRLVADIQSGLAKLGYDPGPADGKLGPKTRSAIVRYQRDKGLPADANPTNGLAAHIEDQVR